MKEELELQLVNKYPNIFKDYKGDPRKTCMAWGMTCGNGWYDILDRACEKLSQYEGVLAEQVKEKFGALRFYISITKKYPEETWKKIFDIARDAEEESLTVCESCGGKKVEPIAYKGWVYGLCDTCLEAVKVRRERGNTQDT